MSHKANVGDGEEPRHPSALGDFFSGCGRGALGYGLASHDGSDGYGDGYEGDGLGGSATLEARSYPYVEFYTG